MKKLLYSTLSIALVASAVLVGCKDNGGGTPDPVVKGPSIEFQTNTGTFSGYTFANDKLPVSAGTDLTKIKIGVKITSNENLKSTKMTVKFNNQAEVIIGTDSLVTSKTCNRDYFFTLPTDKGTYTFTAYATDKNATTTSAKIVITAYGKLGDRGTGKVYSLKAIGATSYSAYDLLTGAAISAGTSAGNEAQRDIVDMSTGSTLSKSWKSQNGTEFVISGVDGKLNGKVYSQFKSEQDVIDAWNVTGGKSTTVTGVDDNKLIIAKSNQGGQTRYYLVAISVVTDDTGVENDTYDFQYQQ